MADSKKNDDMDLFAEMAKGADAITALMEFAPGPKVTRDDVNRAAARRAQQR